MRKSIIAGNWKMHKSPAETKAFFKELLSQNVSSDVRILLAVPFLDIVDALIATEGSAIEIGAQTLSEHSCGAYTGEVAGSMLKEAGVSFVLIGHSERRTHFQETKELLGRLLVCKDMPQNYRELTKQRFEALKNNKSLHAIF